MDAGYVRITGGSTVSCHSRLGESESGKTRSGVRPEIRCGMRNLKRNYFDKGLTTIEQIGAVYAPIGADNDPRNLNQHWVKGVRKYRSSL